MLKRHLKTQNICLTMIMIIIGVSLMWGTLFLLSVAFTTLAIIHTSISISLILIISGMIRGNCMYIKNFISIANIERTTLTSGDENAVRVIESNVPDLGFKFHKD